MAGVAKPGQFPLMFLADGGLAVEQGRVNGRDVTYNPDDGRFYVHDGDSRNNDVPVLATFNRKANAVQFAKKRPVV